MCGAYGFLGVSGFKSSINIWLRYNLKNKPEALDSYNLRPSMKALVVTRNSPNSGNYLTFGIKAPWDENHLLINAKSETVSQLRTFKKMFIEQRCLVPASFFYEWQKHEDGTKTPFCIKVKNNNAISFAGLHTKDGFVILTTKPNKLMESIHNRMPVILRKEDEEIWLNPDSTESELTDLFAPFPETEMEAYPVSKLINSARSQGKELIERAKIQGSLI